MLGMVGRDVGVVGCACQVPAQASGISQTFQRPGAVQRAASQQHTVVIFGHLSSAQSIEQPNKKSHLFDGHCREVMLVVVPPSYCHSALQGNAPMASAACMPTGKGSCARSRTT